MKVASHLVALLVALAAQASRAQIDPGCRIKAGNHMDDLEPEANDVRKKVSTFEFRGAKALLCAKYKDPASPEKIVEGDGKGSTGEVNLEVQFMPGEDPKQYDLKVDESLSKGCIKGKGVGGPEVNNAGISGEINMVVSESGDMMGSARSNGDVYLFLETRFGHTRVTKLNIKDLPDDTEPTEKPSQTVRVLRSGTTENEVEHGRNLQSAPVFIDILVPYTKRAACNIVYGFPTNQCNLDEEALQKMQLFAELNIYESNVAFQNSGIDGRFRLAKTFLVDEDFDEMGQGFDTMLLGLALVNDGYLDRVQEFRDRYGGDMVVLLVDNTQSCGLAYSGLPVAPEWSFAVVYWQCAAGYYSFVHELAHNMGANHDRAAEACLRGQCCRKGCSNYGWQDPRGRFRTIMAYDCPTRDGCPRIQMFSTPTKYYLDYLGSPNPVGDAYNNNALQLMRTWNAVSQNRADSGLAQEVDEIGDGVLERLDPCGNGVCEPELGEDCFSCADDCMGGIFRGLTCGDGLCSGGETCENCPQDCASRLTRGRPDLNYCCVGGIEGRDRTFRSMGDGPLQWAVGCSNNYCRWNTLCDRRNPNGIQLPPVGRTPTYCCGNSVCEIGETDRLCPADCEGKFFTLPRVCMENGRVCAKITPMPCCGVCNEETRKCESG